MNAIAHSQQLSNVAREMEKTADLYRDFKIDGDAVQMYIRHSIIRLRRINTEIDHECEMVGEISGGQATI